MSFENIKKNLTDNFSNEFIENENKQSNNFLKSPPLIKSMELNLKYWKKYPIFTNYNDENKYEKRLNSFSKRLFNEEKTSFHARNAEGRKFQTIGGLYNERKLKRTFKSILYDSL
jgi:hypothetical protein